VKNLVGNKYNRLTVLSFDRKEKKNNHNRYYWNCQCDCGNIVSLNVDNFKRGLSQSCGCFHKEQVIENRTTHGGVGTEEYGIWEGVKDRCLNSNNRAYSRYGGRGITISKEWLDYAVFIQDIGKRPSKDYSIDRIDNNLGYQNGNCKWSTRIEQNRNKRNNVIILDIETGIYYNSISEIVEALDTTTSKFLKKLKQKDKFIRI